MAKIKQIEYPYLLIFSIVLGAFLRFYHIGRQPLWFDEAWSYWFSSKTIPELWTIIAKGETNPPLYYTILKIWMIFFGSTEAALRSLSAVISIGCIPLVFMLGRVMGKSIHGDRIGAIASFMFAVSPVHIQYAQEARTYAMLTFTTMLTLCMFIWIVRHPAEACEPIMRKTSDLKRNSTNSFRWSKFIFWMATIIAITITLWLHTTSILYIATLSLIMLAFYVLQLKFNRMFLNNILIVVFFVLLLWAPYFFFLIPQLGVNFPEAKLTVMGIVNKVIGLILGHTVPFDAIPFFSSGFDIRKIAVFPIILAAAGLLNIWRRSGQYVSLLILGSILGPILMALALGLMFKPIFVARTLVYVSVPFYIAMAAGIMTLRGSWQRVLLIVIISLTFLKLTNDYYRDYKKEPWDKVAQIVLQQAGTDVVLLVPGTIEVPFSYYAGKTIGKNLQVISLPYPTSYFMHPPPGLEHPGSRDWPEKTWGWMFVRITMMPGDIPAVNKAISKESPVWLITRYERTFDPDRLVYNELVQNRHLISQWNFGDMSVFKFI